MAIKKTQQGFALLIAIIFMSVMLSFGLTLGSLAYKQQILASNAVESGYAFYAADAALECALYAGQQLNLFNYASGHPPLIAPLVCSDPSYVSRDWGYLMSATYYTVTQRFSLDAGKHCADVTIYKYNAPPPGKYITTYLFSQGYNVSCDTVDNPNGARLVSRGLNASY